MFVWAPAVFYVISSMGAIVCVLLKKACFRVDYRLGRSPQAFRVKGESLYLLRVMWYFNRLSEGEEGGKRRERE